MPRAPKTTPKPKDDKLFEQDGRLFQKCQYRNGTCPRVRPVEEFAPRRSEANLALFLQAAALYKETQSAEARATVVQHVVKDCDHCRDITKGSRVSPSSKPGQCRAYLHKLRATEFRTCVHCGTARCIELDNVVSDADRAVMYAGGEVYVPEHHCLSDYHFWAQPAHGGVEGMRLEKAVCEPCCTMCHRLQPTGDAANRVDPATLPPTYPGEQRDGKAGKEMYHKRWNARISWPRYMYVDSLKRAIGQCENLDCPRDGPWNGKCVAGVEQCFDWEHVDAKAKKTEISKMCTHLPANMPEADWKAEIHAELKRGKCRLLCGNCHHLKTHYGAVMRYE